MMALLLEFALRQRIVVVLVAFALLGAGLWAAHRLPIDALPDITNVQVQINTSVQGFAPEEIEKLVTYPIEMQMSGIQGMTEMRSISQFGLSQVTLTFEDGTDVYRARQLVTERIQNAVEDLPKGLVPKLAPVTTGLGEIYYYVVEYKADFSGKPVELKDQLMALTLVEDSVIKPALKTVPGVADVSVTGGYEKQITILPELDKLAAAGLSFKDLADVVAQNTENAGGSAVQIGGEQILVRTTARVQSLPEIENLPLKFRSGTKPILVKDVADVQVGTGIRTGAATFNGKEAVLGAVLMIAGENSRIVAKRVAGKLEEITDKLPEGVEVRTVYNRTALVDRTIATVEKNLTEGALCVVIILLVLLGNWRAALIVSLIIPLSFLFALVGMVELGVSGNLMSLGAVDFGLIIDGAVVMVENIVRRLGIKQHQMGRSLNGNERRSVVLAAAKEVGMPTFFGVLIITIVYLPLLSLTGIEGKMFRPMATTVIMALVGALFLALTLMPVLCSLLLRGIIPEEENWLVRNLKANYRSVLDWALRWHWWLVGGAVILFATALFVFGTLGAEFVPQLDEGSISTQVYRTTSIGLDAAIAMQERTETVLRDKFPEITDTFSRIGTSEIASDPQAVNSADGYIFYKPRSEWRKLDGHTATKEELVDLMSHELNMRVPGQVTLFSQPIQQRFSEILEGTKADVAVKVFGDDYAVLERLAGEAKEILEKVPGAGDVEYDQIGRAPMLNISLKRDVMTQFNLQAKEVNDAVATALGGEEAGQIIDGNRRYPIVIRLPEGERSDMELMKSIPVHSPDGGILKLGQVANFEVTDQVSTINREFGQRRVAILVKLRGRDVESFVKEAQRKIRGQVKLPPGYNVEFGGQFKNLEDARTRLEVIVPVSLLVIFILIFIAFGSIRQVLVVYSGIPLAIAGGVFALWIRGMPFSISAGVGFIALSGVAVLNGLMMVSYFNQLRAQGMGLLDAVREGSVTRLRPVLITALVASLGFLPMALSAGAGAEVQRPIATVVIGGIFSASFLTLLLLPTLYHWVEDRWLRRTA